MNDQLSFRRSAQLVPTSADGAAAQMPNDELSDADLEQLVGGLARTWNGIASDVLGVNPSYTIARLDPHDIGQRISA